MSSSEHRSGDTIPPSIEPSPLERHDILELLIGDVVSEVKFTAKTNRKGEIVSFVSSEPGRKAIVLDELTITPLESYSVEIYEDTLPSDPLKGCYKARLVPNPEGSGEPPLKNESKETLKPTAIEIDRERGVVYILDLELPLCTKASSFVPHPKKFQFFTWDSETIGILYKVAQAVKLKQPCLLEGPTAASKTSAIEYLAMLTGHGVLRINLSGQTDTSELIGKFVPNDGQLTIKFEELLQSKERLSDSSRDILEKAEAEKRPLTQVESKIIAHNENFAVPEWRWKDGVVPRGMKEGLWVILDEWNLAEQDVRERLNSALERPPSITLTENGDTTIGPNGDFKVHPDHNLFATMNPAGGEYEKRKPMSPAEADRWPSYTQVGSPKADSYKQMLVKAIYGRQPSLTFDKKEFGGIEGESSFPVLKEMKKEVMEAFIVSLSNFHYKLAEMAESREIGKERKQKYIFTRRGLIEFLAYIEAADFVTDRKTRASKNVKNAPKEIIQKALQYYYLDRIHSSDHAKIQVALDLYGLSDSKWQFKFDV